MTSAQGQPAPWPDLAQEMLRRPSAGRVFLYSDASTYVAMRALGARVGDVRDWLLPRLFDPLGIDDPQWHRGAWKGRQIVSAAFVDAMHADWVATEGPADFRRYGLAVWGGPGDAWRLDGRYGQYVIVDSARDAVVTITAHEEERDHRMAELAVAALER